MVTLRSKAAEKSILKVSYIGYAAQIIPVSKKDFYPVVMKQDTEVLDEVVVTALGIKRAEKGVVLQCTTSQGRCTDYGKRC